MREGMGGVARAHAPPTPQAGGDVAVTASASDADEASTVMSQVFDQLTVRAHESTVDMALHCVQLPAVKLVNLAISNSTITTEALPFYTVATTRSGRADVTVRDETHQVPANGAMVISAGRPLEVVYSARLSRMTTVLVDRTALDDELSAMLGRTVSAPIKFEHGTGADATANPFHRALALLTSEVTGPMVFAGQPKLSSHLTRLLMAGLLLGFPHNHSEALASPGGFVGPRAIRAAVTAIEEDPMAIATVADLARHANLGVRALEDGFRAHLHMSPMKYLRSVRMARVHADLRRRSPDTTTATAVAHQWGFSHYGRFASAYRQKYGRTPAETLRREQ